MNLETYPEILIALQESEAGKSLKEIYRWSSGGFRQQESNETWEKVFGVTAVDFKHGVLMYNIGKAFLAHTPGLFNNGQQKTFLYGLLSHDFGEAKINGDGVGDVSAQNKTLADEHKEEAMAHRVIKTLKLPEKTKSALLEGYKKTVEGEDKELNSAFKALEKSEYVFTAMKVFQNAHKLRAEGLPSMDEEMEKALIGRVLVIDLPKVLDMYIPKFPDFLGKTFKCAVPLIDEMFAYSLPWLESHDEWGGKPVDHKALAESFKIKWENFKTSNF